MELAEGTAARGTVARGNRGQVEPEGIGPPPETTQPNRDLAFEFRQDTNHWTTGQYLERVGDC